MGYEISFHTEKDYDLITATYEEHSYSDCDEAVATFYCTYNYSKFFYTYIDSEEGIRSFYDVKAKSVAKVLFRVINQMDETTEVDDYWAGTEGNARKALVKLLDLCLQHPNTYLLGD